MPPKNGLQKIQPKNPSRAQSKIQSADVAGVEASQHALLRSKNYPEKLKISSARSSAPLCLPRSFRKFLPSGFLPLSRFQIMLQVVGKELSDEFSPGENVYSTKDRLIGILETQWARRDILMSRVKNCHETLFVSQLSPNYPRRGAILREASKPSLKGERQFGRHFKRLFGRG